MAEACAGYFRMSSGSLQIMLIGRNVCPNLQMGKQRLKMIFYLSKETELWMKPIFSQESPTEESPEDLF